ncbi:MAG: BadF/BadG/BcrA/BcrD ATPase family protein [Nitrososphaeria archaeon]
MLILCMDIGKTKTLAITLDQNGNIFGKFTAGPSGMWLKEEVVIRNIKEAINGCLSISNFKLEDVDLISISWADLDTQKDWENAWKVIERIGIEKKRVLIEHDAVAAYYAVTWGEPGAAVIGGTGSIAFGVNRRGQSMRSSGWGWLIGDEGSAYWIAVKALNAVSRAHDGRGKETILSKMFTEYFNVANELDILHKVYKEIGGDPTEISKLAKIVDKAACLGDEVAIEILDEAGKELALAISCIVKRLGMEDERIVVGGLGGVFRSNIVKESFMHAIKESVPKAIVREPLIGDKAILGPIVIAYKRLGLKVSEENIRLILNKLEE